MTKLGMKRLKKTEGSFFWHFNCTLGFGKQYGPIQLIIYLNQLGRNLLKNVWKMIKILLVKSSYGVFTHRYLTILQKTSWENVMHQ